MASPIHYSESQSDDSQPPLHSFDGSQPSPRRPAESIFTNSEIEDPSNSQFPPEDAQLNLQDAHIWGTDINVKACMTQLKLFLCEFREDISGSPKYIKVLDDIEETQNHIFTLNCSDLNDFNPTLYRQLVSYPQEILPLFDAVVNKEYQTRFSDEPALKQIQVQTHNLTEISKMRDINPDDIDCLIAFSAMVTRVSAVIPDLKVGFFRCSKCRHETAIEVDRGRVNQPTICANKACQGRDSYIVIHNRCEFADKQLVRAQETPESIPEGETPQTVDIFCHGNLIDVVMPGDRVEVTGIYRAIPMRVNSNKRNLKAIYRGYVNAIHFKKSLKRKFQTNKSALETDKQSNQTEEATKAEIDAKKQKLRALAKDPDIYQKLVNSIAPSIWELEDVKRGLLCQLFGGAAKKRENKSFFRSEINVLLCGDPGTSKSQLLQYAHKISARGIYTSGKGSSAVGLTASISRDPETRETVLESGALVLSDRGICCIDEFDKMSESARSVLHEVMEQQTISVAKAGVICSLNARVSILAAANPRESRYDAALSVVDNITLPPALLSRFDLIYIVLDKPNERLDRRLAQHIVSLYGLERAEAPGDFLSADTLADYIALAREEVNPAISDEAATRLIEGYLRLRKSGRFRNKKIIAATPRQLESLIRISESLARMRFSKEVEERDVDEAIRLMKVATQSAATDPKTGVINMDLITVDSSAMERKEMLKKTELIMDILDDYNDPKCLSFLLAAFNQKSKSKQNFGQFKEMIRQLEQKELIQCKDWLARDPLIFRKEK